MIPADRGGRAARDRGGVRALPWVWGATSAECETHYPCDEVAGEGSARAIRAVTAQAPAADCFVWLCQLRRAPYSYDLIDNFGRRSPRVADPELAQLRPGLTFMTFFTLVAFIPGRSVTFKMKPGLPSKPFGALVLTYDLVERGGRTRMIGVLAMPPVRGPLARLRRLLLAWADVVMMRKQLMVLAGLAERDTRRRRVDEAG